LQIKANGSLVSSSLSNSNWDSFVLLIEMIVRIIIVVVGLVPGDS
jgi:hypothetical protein